MTKDRGKKLKVGHRAFKALWLPLLWVILLSLELAFVVDNSRHHLAVRFFEDVVFIMSFLFYNSKGLQGYMESPLTTLFISFSLQFLFWWGVSYWFLFTKDKLSKKRGSNA